MEQVIKFEKEIAEFYGSPYAVATDSCTHAIELCLRHTTPDTELTIPSRTYISVPFTFIKLGLKWRFVDQPWQDYYYIGGTKIVDAAVHFKQGGYIPGTLMCLSFQFKKTLGLGRGGMILCDSEDQYNLYKMLSYDGRTDDAPWRQQDISTVGYHYYMTPETAELGSQKLQTAQPKATQGSYDYPYLPNMQVFK